LLARIYSFQPDLKEAFATMMKKNLPLVLASLALTLPAVAQNKIDDRLSESNQVLKLMAKPDAIPKALLNKAACVLVFPSVRKVGVGIGVTYGRGVLVCRSGANMNGKWSAPAMYRLNVGSLGLQLGSSQTDYVLLVESQAGAIKVLTGKLKLGADASAVAGPTGAKAVSTADSNVDLLTYSRAKGGLFAGASLGSAQMDSDDDANKTLYGKQIDATQIVRDGAVTTPASGRPLVATLTRLSPKRTK
jgi:lipid-binding SYLF domain-containing protein